MQFTAVTLLGFAAGLASAAPVSAPAADAVAEAKPQTYFGESRNIHHYYLD